MKDGSLDYFAHKFALGLSTTRSLLLSALGTALTDMISPVYTFLSTKFLHTRLSVGGASLLENWILEGDEQGNFPVNAFQFFCPLFLA